MKNYFTKEKQNKKKEDNPKRERKEPEHALE